MFERTVRDRWELIEPLVRSGSVLDVGCCDARPARAAPPALAAGEQRAVVSRGVSRGAARGGLFRRMHAVNPRVVGLDQDADGVAALVREGFEAVAGDAETTDLGRHFDCIVAGEVIEHLANPGRFLENMRRHLAPGGALVLTTPNPFAQGQTSRIWRRGRPLVHEEHTNWQDPTTLAVLLGRAGLRVADGAWIQPPRALTRSWKRLLRPWFAHSFAVVARSAQVV